jgi:hypothetical protein
VFWLKSCETQLLVQLHEILHVYQNFFAGGCPNGNKYRIYSYQMEVDGLTQSFYDYEGPAGKDTVRTNAQPKKMATRVCHELADIGNGSRFD